MKLIRLTMAVTALMPLFAQAQQSWREVDWGNLIVRAGGTYIHPRGDATSLQYPILQNWDLFRTRWDFDSDTTWNLSVAWQPMDHWGFELMHIFNAQYDIQLSRFTGIPGRDLIELGKFEVTTSNAFINWYPLQPDCLGRPYFGVGVNYTDFRDMQLSHDFNRFLIDSDVSTGPADFNMGYSWGWAAQVGVDFTYSRSTPWLANVAVLYLDSDTNTRITFPTELGYDHLRAKVDYDPWMLNLSIGYRF
ncbi:OmpW family outer membrane protein [Microbulbifer sp. SAOS-129_SWC]|uniref:OmpW/AlkL family protein n=1 Tax=Microbulbifer sp. SAOS-129_SWC TaxID=3145235 RepID=UPI00321635D5